MGTQEPEILAPERLDLRHIELTLVGDSILVTNNWSEKAKEEMRNKQAMKGTQPKQAKDPQACYEGAFYRMADGAPGFPAIGIKGCAVRGSKALGMTMTDMRAAFHINADLLPILSDPPVMREDMVRVGKGTADMRYRPEFNNWSIVVPIVYNARVISAEQIVAILNSGGFGTGIGEWRPEHDGSWGRFHVEGGPA